MTIYIDTVLKNVATEIKANNLALPNLDRRILLSLTNQLDQGHFLTENQSKLTIKIFKENMSSIERIEPTIKDAIELNQWSKNFRMIQKIRKIYPSQDSQDMVCIEFTYDKRLKEKLLTLAKQIDGSITAIGNRTYGVSFTEKNIHVIVGNFLKEDFIIHDKILNFYYDIDALLTSKSNNFDIFTTDNRSIKTAVEFSVGPISPDNLIMLNDRKIRHQYQIFQEITPSSLTEKIALRKSTKIFIDETKISLTDVIQSIKDLNRFPVLCVFEGHTPKINKKTLDNLYDALTDHNMADKVGIYFRFDKSENSVEFNATISDRQLNKNLDESTQVAGIANNKLPKFFLKSKWKPQTVISFTNTFKNNKSAVYCNNVDLIVYYTDKIMLVGDVDVIV